MYNEYITPEKHCKSFPRAVAEKFSAFPDSGFAETGFPGYITF